MPDSSSNTTHAAADVFKGMAGPLALLYAGLIVYASLFPFEGWRSQGLPFWSFVQAPWPQYWTGFDLGSNLLGYAPLGFLLMLAFVLHMRGRWACVLAIFLSALLSFTLESLQSYLPLRIASNLDWGLNTAGGAMGALLAWALMRLGWLARWSRFRARWFVPHARGTLVLLALWPVALLYPASVAFGLGQVFERAEDWLGQALQDTPYLDWLPMREMELQPLLPGQELICVAVGLLSPVLLGYSVIGPRWRRAVFAVACLALGYAASALSSGLSYGPLYAWAWVSTPVKYGSWLAVILAVALLWVPRRVAAGLLLLALPVSLMLLNNAPTSAYFSETLSAWEQGRFIRFYGLIQWLGWLWPYAALVQLLATLTRRERLWRGNRAE
jgi:VanZ family protein